MDQFTQALEIIAQVMREGVATHPDNDWLECSPQHHIRRAVVHLQPWRDGDQI